MLFLLSTCILYTIYVLIRLRYKLSHPTPTYAHGTSSFGVHNLSILFVDDLDFNIKLGKMMLSHFSSNIDIAKNGQEAVERIKSKTYDLVFMDCMMPVIDGLEATRRIRDYETIKGHRKRLPIVGVSATATLTECLEAGMNRLLIKPALKRDYQKVITELGLMSSITTTM